jgi:hypothetical protein
MIFLSLEEYRPCLAKILSMRSVNSKSIHSLDENKPTLTRGCGVVCQRTEVDSQDLAGMEAEETLW